AAVKLDGVAHKDTLAKLANVFRPFLHSPDGTSRPIVDFIHFPPYTKRTRKVAVITALQAAVARGGICDPAHHSIGLYQHTGEAARGATFAVDLATELGISEVVLEGEARRDAQDRIALPGLLTYFKPSRVNNLLRYAAANGVRLSPRNVVDTPTVARNVWNGLNTARSMGVNLGKYGLLPLTLEEQETVMQHIQSWYPFWAAAPAFYVDQPAVDVTKVYLEGEIVHAAKKWLEMAARTGIEVVLFDSPDRTPAPVGSSQLLWQEDRGRRLLKRTTSDPVGLLTFAQLDDLLAEGQRLGVKILWAGGINAVQAYQLAKRGVFGIYTTSSTARLIAVQTADADRVMAAQPQPTKEGVFGIKLLLEAGFLVTRTEALGHERSERLDKTAATFLDLIEGLRGELDQERIRVRDDLVRLVEDGWRIHFDS
ncbi:MAG: hypothetical protein ACC652_09170, partial [Acidimicrobiales bacterium]